MSLGRRSSVQTLANTILKMDIESYFKSITSELNALKNRVRNFIDDAHWLTDGEWKESVLRNLLSKNLPESVRIGRGFIISNVGVSSQIDVLIYRWDSPLFFKDGDLVFAPPEAILGIIEVKTRLTKSTLQQAVTKLGEIRKHLHGSFHASPLVALFSYEEELPKNEELLETVRDIENAEELVSLICLGHSRLIKYYSTNPKGNNALYEKWHSYTLDHMAPGYFIHDILLRVTPEEFWMNKQLWAPEELKERFKDGEIFKSNSLVESLELALANKRLHQIGAKDAPPGEA